jgi:hypothetical protein
LTRKRKPAEILTDLKAHTLVAKVEREDRDAPAIILHDEDLGFEINADMGSRQRAARQLERVAWTILAVVEELRGGPPVPEKQGHSPINVVT